MTVPTAPVHKSGRAISRSAIVSYAALITLLALIPVGVPAYSATETYVISSSSMEPALRQYDMVVVDRALSFDHLEVGDIITFLKPDGQDRTIVSRVVAVDSSSGDRVITTKETQTHRR